MVTEHKHGTFDIKLKLFIEIPINPYCREVCFSSKYGCDQHYKHQLLGPLSNVYGKTSAELTAVQKAPAPGPARNTCRERRVQSVGKETECMLAAITAC